MLVAVVSVQVMVIDVAVCMVALRLLGGLGTASVIMCTVNAVKCRYCLRYSEHDCCKYFPPLSHFLVHSNIIVFFSN